MGWVLKKSLFWPLCALSCSAPYRAVLQDEAVSDSSAEFAGVAEDLYRREGARLWRSLLGYTADRELATDAVAEAFAQALRRGAVIEDPKAWVWRAGFKIASGELKKRGRLRAIEEGDQPVVESQVPGELFELLRRLPARQRAVVLLRFYAGYSTSEVAAISGCTPGTVRMHLSQARRRLRRLLEEDDA